MKGTAAGLAFVALLGGVGQSTPTSPTNKSTVSGDVLQAQVLELREQVQRLKAELITTKIARDTFEYRWRGCESAMNQNVQAAYDEELRALQKESREIEAARNALGTPKPRK